MDNNNTELNQLLNNHLNPLQSYSSCIYNPIGIFGFETSNAFFSCSCCNFFLHVGVALSFQPFSVSFFIPLSSSSVTCTTFVYQNWDCSIPCTTSNNKMKGPTFWVIYSLPRAARRIFVSSQNLWPPLGGSVSLYGLLLYSLTVVSHVKLFLAWSNLPLQVWILFRLLWRLVG
jgi:hypothetical protein